VKKPRPNPLIFRREHVSYASAQVRGHIRLPAVGKLDDVTWLRMHREADQDALDLLRALMSMHVTCW
jgi:hypothetical protein